MTGGSKPVFSTDDPNRLKPGSHALFFWVRVKHKKLITNITLITSINNFLYLKLPKMIVIIIITITIITKSKNIS